MSNIKEALNGLITESDWQKMAKHAGMSAAEVKSTILDAYEQQGEVEPQFNVGTPVLSDATSSNGCIDQDFDVSLFDLVAVKGNLTICDIGSPDWTASLTAHLVLAGVTVWTITYQFDAHNLRVCFHPNLLLVKATLCFAIDIESDKVCFNISGKACVRNWRLKWVCGDFDFNLFCIPTG